MKSIRTCKKIDMIVFYSLIKKNPEISFQNGPEHEVTSLNVMNNVILWCHSVIHFLLTQYNNTTQPRY